MSFDTETEEPRKIYVGSINYSTSEEVLKQHFSSFGPVEDVTIIIDRVTRKSKGFGFVTFQNKVDCESALNAGSLEVDGRQVRVNKAQKQTHRVQGDSYRGGRGAGYGHGGYSNTGASFGFGGGYGAGGGSYAGGWASGGTGYGNPVAPTGMNYGQMQQYAAAGQYSQGTGATWNSAPYANYSTGQQGYGTEGYNQGGGY